MDARVKPAHDETLVIASEAKQSRATRKTGLLRFARNDGAALRRRPSNDYFL
jgi:hypothetical protein